MIKYTCVCMSMFKGDVLLSMENLQEQKKKKELLINEAGSYRKAHP